jgi:hypothetical protein
MAELFIFSDAINKYINKQMIILLEREANTKAISILPRPHPCGLGF